MLLLLALKTREIIHLGSWDLENEPVDQGGLVGVLPDLLDKLVSQAGHVLAVLEPTEMVLSDLGRGDLDTGEALEFVEGAVHFLFEFESKKWIEEGDMRRMKPLLLL